MIRPDILYAVKYLSTKSGKATKADMVQVERLIRKLKEIPRNNIIPDLGEPEDWVIVGVVNASHRTTGNVSAIRGHVVTLVNKYTKAPRPPPPSTGRVIRLRERSVPV